MFKLFYDIQEIPDRYSYVFINYFWLITEVTVFWMITQQHAMLNLINNSTAFICLITVFTAQLSDPSLTFIYFVIIR